MGQKINILKMPLFPSHPSQTLPHLLHPSLPPPPPPISPLSSLAFSLIYTSVLFESSNLNWDKKEDREGDSQPPGV